MTGRQLVFEDFADKVGKVFPIGDQDVPAIPLTLKEAELFRTARLERPGMRLPFSLIFPSPGIRACCRNGSTACNIMGSVRWISSWCRSARTPRASQHPLRRPIDGPGPPFGTMRAGQPFHFEIDLVVGDIGEAEAPVKSQRRIELLHHDADALAVGARGRLQRAHDRRAAILDRAMTASTQCRRCAGA